MWILVYVPSASSLLAPRMLIGRNSDTRKQIVLQARPQMAIPPSPVIKAVRTKNRSPWGFKLPVYAWSTRLCYTNLLYWAISMGRQAARLTTVPKAAQEGLLQRQGYGVAFEDAGIKHRPDFARVAS